MSDWTPADLRGRLTGWWSAKDAYYWRGEHIMPESRSKRAKVLRFIRRFWPTFLKAPH